MPATRRITLKLPTLRLDIRHLREALNFSQPVFAMHLHTSVSTVRKWEQGETRPAGPALKLLNIIQCKGLQAIL
ncbi:helix-turn-helix domain-containing protein [Pseudomonas sp. SWRI77]|uniref:helix-turn-helix domain-containing protein n=1 Tax=Pseudomonas sp. SWRI77 TaxID=2745485 RepID=UPI0016442A24|nr:helix-turn-helix domain-containing protein [Pseudomonas sp. SWRI77]